MNILEHIKQTRVLDLNIFGVDASITNGVLTMFLAVALALSFFLAASRRAKLVPGALQSVAEYLIEFVREEMIKPLGDQADTWLPFIVSLFSFIFVCNLLGLVPGLLPPTGNINVTATLAVMIFLTTHVVGVQKHGFTGYIKSLVPPGLPLPVTVFLFPVEIVGQLARPFSLAVRLFANMFAGHTIIMMLISLIFIFRSYFVIPFPIIGNIAISAFEVFVALVQAFIFTYLSSLYIVGALQTEH